MIIVRDLAQTNQGKAVQDELSTLFFATYDMVVHTPASRDALENLDLIVLFNQKKLFRYLRIQGSWRGGLGEGWKWGHGQTILLRLRSVTVLLG